MQKNDICQQMTGHTTQGISKVDIKQQNKLHWLYDIKQGALTVST